MRADPPQRLGTCALVLCSLLALAPRVRAQPELAQPVPLTMPIVVAPCVPVDEASFRRQLAIELEAAPQASDLARAEATATVALGCADQQIDVMVSDAAAHKAWRRKLDLRGVDPRAHNRLLALSVAELLLASWLELRLPPPPSAARAPAPEKRARPAEDDASPESPAPAIAPARAEPMERRALQLGAAGEILGFTSAMAPIFGAQLHVSVPLSGRWALCGAAQGGYGKLDGTLRGSDPARLHVTAASLALRLDWHARQGDLDVRLGAGVRLGLLHLAGTPADERVVAARAFAPWVGPLLSPALRYRLHPRVHASLSVEAGLLAVQVRALGPAEDVVLRLSGLWLLASVGLELAYWP